MSDENAEKGERIAKRLARAGLCSRRDAERWIAEGRVSVNGKKLDSPACVVGEDDIIVVDGKPLPEAERTRVWRYHKPTGLVTTHKDDLGRPTVFERLPADMPRVISVGRLDLNSEGLLLLTNDGALARELELPSRGWVRRYRVRVFGRPTPEELASLEKGITVDGVRYGPIKAVLDSQAASNAWLTVSIQEGKNREIRKVMEHMGWDVSRLIRVAYGPFQLGNLPEREVEEVTGKVIKDQLGVKPKAKAASAAAVPAPEPVSAEPDESWAKPNIARPKRAAKSPGKPAAKREEPEVPAPDEVKAKPKPNRGSGWAKAKPKPNEVKRKPRRTAAKAEAGPVDAKSGKPAPRPDRRKVKSNENRRRRP